MVAGVLAFTLRPDKSIDLRCCLPSHSTALFGFQSEPSTPTIAREMPMKFNAGVASPSSAYAKLRRDKSKRTLHANQ